MTWMQTLIQSEARCRQPRRSLDSQQRVDDDLGLLSGQPVDIEAMIALEYPHDLLELGVEDLGLQVGRRVPVVDCGQAVTQPGNGRSPSPASLW